MMRRPGGLKEADYVSVKFQRIRLMLISYEAAL
jgi:hypothetical protein